MEKRNKTIPAGKGQKHDGPNHNEAEVIAADDVYGRKVFQRIHGICNAGKEYWEAVPGDQFRTINTHGRGKRSQPQPQPIGVFFVLALYVFFNNLTDDRGDGGR